MPCRSLGKCASSGTIPVLMLKFLPLNLEKDVALLAYYSMASQSFQVYSKKSRASPVNFLNASYRWRFLPQG